MKCYQPTYYDSFSCLAGACPDSCCQEWAVQVDPESADFYRTLPGPLGDRLRQVLTEEDGDTILEIQDGRCPMWRRDGLCRIQAELGESALCETCRDFPRLRHDYGDFVELGLELSCPEAARLILADPGTPLVERELSGGEEPEYDGDAMAVLKLTRREALALLDGTYPAGEALALLLLYGAQAQQALDGGERPDFSPEAALEAAREFGVPGDMGGILTFFQNLEILTPRWQERLQNPQGRDWEPGHLALARYFVNRYWLQAVSDYDLYGRVKLTVISCLVVKTLGGNLTETAQLFSKEIENDTDNIDAILDGAYESPAFADTALLGLLLPHASPSGRGG